MPIFQSKKDYPSPKMNSVPQIRDFALQNENYQKKYQKRAALEEQMIIPASIVILSITV